MLRAGFAASIMFVFLMVTVKKDKVVTALVFAIFAMALYVPTGYYLELFLYRRRLRRKEPSR